MSEKLTQDDFRKILATPRPDRHASSTPRVLGGGIMKPRQAVPRTPRGDTFAVPKTPRSKKPAEPREPKEERNDNYRDRAAERRLNQEEDLEAGDLLRKLAQSGSGGSLATLSHHDGEDTLDPKTIYEQSKYLGGDAAHTHLVKGLDFALLRKVRAELSKAEEEQNNKMDGEGMDEDEAEEVLDQALAKAGEDGTVHVEDDSMEAPRPKQAHQVVSGWSTFEAPVDTKLPWVKRMFATLQAAEQKPAKRNTLFEPGRTYFSFSLDASSDPFAIPSTIVRSKADMAARSFGKAISEVDEREKEVVLNMVTSVIERLRTKKPSTNGQPKAKNAAPSTEREAHQPLPPPMDDNEDIFADAGRDYELDETTVDEETGGKGDKIESTQNATVASESDPAASVVPTKRNYFIDDPDQESMDAEFSPDAAVNALLARAKAEGTSDSGKPAKAAKTSAYEDDYIEFGLGAEELPELKEGETKIATKQRLSQPNRKLTRWDFDSDEAWIGYRESMKDASDEEEDEEGGGNAAKKKDMSRSERRKAARKGMTEQQKLDGEWHALKSFMEHKYG
ncbi:hypothetical protein BZG36_01038 [Bifiguratus adelaidae]|uniref:RED-like N-terminal domain-containing protein n=1 Tax=Bifiguratus adelaidae TaxID=1938954 RepID=A0A261Y6A5_9FUNG|nr:hypothetical protein BZG36_01038 [Bifiguratus adelaidae]